MKAQNTIKLLIVALAGLAVSQTALAQGVGNLGSLPSMFQQNAGGGWQIGSPASPIPVVRDPLGPQWLKHLTDSTGGPITALPNQVFDVQETLVIAGNLPWSDWHEQILTPGFSWTGNVVFWGNFAPPPGLQVFNTPGNTVIGGNLTFLFNSLAPGTVIHIRKQIIADGIFGAIYQGPIDVAQYPTPEPTSLALLGAGGLAMFRRRRVAG